MKTKDQLEHDILNIVKKIRDDFPELIKYMDEMPFSTSKNNQHDVNEEDLEAHYNRLEKLLENYSNAHILKVNNLQDNVTAYPLYPASEDIYNQDINETALDPGNLLKNKVPNEDDGSILELDFAHDQTGYDLDVPGSELDDQQESVGSEDEENNYYSLGGDGHNDLEEDQA